MTIVEYKKNAGRLETRICTEHKDQPYILGCAGCLSVFCSECFADTNICDNGESCAYTIVGAHALSKKLRNEVMCWLSRLADYPSLYIFCTTTNVGR